MSNIFDTNILYPAYDSPLKEHFIDNFEAVFIAFSPFFLIGKAENRKAETQIRSTKIITLSELQKKYSIFKNIQLAADRLIYSSDNANYPTDDEILAYGKVVTWQYILENAGFKNLGEISLALRTSIGALNKEFKTSHLIKVLDEFTIHNSIYHPVEGRITILSLIQIYHCLFAMKKFDIVIADEFFQDSTTISLSTVTCSEFISKVKGYVYFFPTDKSILFTIEWDSFFFLICGDQLSLDFIINNFDFEGFYCDSDTMHNWDL